MGVDDGGKLVVEIRWKNTVNGGGGGGGINTYYVQQGTTRPMVVGDNKKRAMSSRDKWKILGRL